VSNETEAAEVLWDLEQLKEADGLTSWMFAQFEEHVHGRVLEVGSGIGTFSERILSRPVSHVLLMEPYLPCVDVLRKEFSDRPNVTILPETLPDSPSLAEERERVDFILCQNVLEHIEDHEAALRAMAASLKPGGRLGLLVPAHPRLFGNLDRKYEHHRRYTRPLLRELLPAAGFEIDDLYSFNVLGIPGWWVQSRREDGQISRRSLAAYEFLLRGWRPLEERIRPPVGLSLIAQARKPE
jgi:SAM-dependent methyltransferase